MSGLLDGRNPLKWVPHITLGRMMTYLYDWYRFPDTVSICCVRCGREAMFSEHRTGNSPPPRSPIPGRSTCLSCGYSGSHVVSWPENAYYKTDVRGHVLWAWSADAVEALIRYLAAKHRREKDYQGYFSFLLHLPTEFKKAEVREEAVQKLRHLLLKK